MRKVSKHTRFTVCIASMIVILGICALPKFSLQAQASSDDIEFLKIGMSHLQEEVDKLQTEYDNLKETVETHITNDVGISKIEKTATTGNIDTYTITFTNNTTFDFTVTNGLDGEDGKDGADGKDGIDGKDGADGKDGVGISKIEKTATTGNIDVYTITFTDETTYAFTVTNGLDGKDGVDGVNGKDGEVAVSQAAASAGTSFLTIIVIIIASIALIGNVIMAVLMMKNKK